MQNQLLENYLKENYEVYDRFTFDKVFRFLLSNAYPKEEAKNIILHNCALSALVFQERLYNKYYLNISVEETISDDLIILRNQSLFEIVAKITEVCQAEIEDVSGNDCISFITNLVINRIYNREVIDEIKKEIERLKNKQ